MSDRNITGHTELYGILATPIRHSGSPKMYNETFKALGMDCVYLAFEVGIDGLEDAVKGFRRMNVRGFNLSMPNKTAVIQYLDKLSREADLCQAVNTVVNENGVLTGYNTDGIGYVAALKDNGIDITGKKITLAGAGGAGKAVAVQCALDGAAEISIFNAKDQFWDQAEKLVQDVNDKTACTGALYDLADLAALKREIADSYLFTNATRMGMKPLDGQTYIPDRAYFRPDLIVTDTVYAPKETSMLKMAKEAGCKTMNGEGMLFYQGVAAFKIWTGKQMPIEHMKKFLQITY